MQQYDNKKTRWLGNAIASFVLMLMLAIFAALICGCTRKIYVPTESTAIRSDSVNLFHAEKEYIHDTDTLMLYMRGDTVFRDKIKWRTRTVTVHDSVYVAVHDTVRVKEPYPVEKIVEVERKRRWWETALMWAGGITLVISIIVLGRRFKSR